MRYLVVLVALIACFLPLHAGNLIQNGDFADGIDHWYGGGRSPADYASDNPLNQSDPFTSKGLIMPLKSETWAKVAQDFKGKGSNGVLTITYMISKDFAFSDKADDYVNMPHQISYDGWKAFNTPPGKWVVFLSDFGSSKGTYYELQPKLGSSAPQSVRLLIKSMTPMETKTIALAFPPGTGTLVVLGVDLEAE